MARFGSLKKGAPKRQRSYTMKKCKTTYRCSRPKFGRKFTCRKVRKSHRKSHRKSKGRVTRRKLRRGFGAFGQGAPDSLLSMQGPYGANTIGWWGQGNQNPGQAANRRA